MLHVERSFSIKFKRDALTLIEQVGVADAAERLSVGRPTLYDWIKQADDIRGFKGCAMSKTLKGQGHKEIFPCVLDLVTYMKDVRRDEAVLSTRGIINEMWKLNPSWMDTYTSGKANPEVALERTVQQMANRYAFSSQKPQAAIRPWGGLELTRAEFATEFWGHYEAFQGGGILNVDETGILFDMPPLKSWAGKGRQDAARILGANKIAGSLTAVLTVRDDGSKLPILFIIRGLPGGTIEQSEFDEYPDGHFYTVQENAWMDRNVWNFYVEKLLKYDIDGPSVLLLDNFECHVSEEGQRIVAEVVNATVVPLPQNSTEVCQPLDVGVMGPLKAKLRCSLSVTGGSAKEKRLRAVKSTITAWNAIESRTIIRSFQKAIPRYPEVTI